MKKTANDNVVEINVIDPEFIFQVMPTDHCTEIDGARCRFWQGAAPDGSQMVMWVLRVALVPGAHSQEAAAMMAKHLVERDRTPMVAADVEGESDLYFNRAPPGEDG
jgi:hypothetical protein